MKKIYFVLVLGAVAAFGTSCRKDYGTDIPTPGKTQVNNTKDLTVPNNFNWSMVKTVEITVNAVTPGVMTIEDQHGSVYEKAMVTPGTPYITLVTVPSSDTKIFILLNGKKEAVEVSGKPFVSTLN